MKHVLFLFLLGVFAPVAVGAVVYDDGLFHSFNGTIEGTVTVSNKNTTLRLLSNAVVTDYAQVLSGALIELYGGTVGTTGSGYLYGKGGDIIVTSGIVKKDIQLCWGSDLLMSGGSVGEDVELFDSTATIAAGNIANWIMAWGTSTINIVGGNLHSIRGYNTSTINLRGGTVNTDIVVTNVATIKIYGKDFNYPAGPVPYSSGMITGVLENGDPINVPFTINHAGTEFGQVILIPEPSTIVFLAWGLLLLRKRP